MRMENQRADAFKLQSSWIDEREELKAEIRRLKEAQTHKPVPTSPVKKRAEEKATLARPKGKTDVETPPDNDEEEEWATPKENPWSRDATTNLPHQTPASLYETPPTSRVNSRRTADSFSDKHWDMKLQHLKKTPGRLQDVSGKTVPQIEGFEDHFQVAEELIQTSRLDPDRRSLHLRNKELEAELAYQQEKASDSRFTANVHQRHTRALIRAQEERAAPRNPAPESMKEHVSVKELQTIRALVETMAQENSELKEEVLRLKQVKHESGLSGTDTDRSTRKSRRARKKDTASDREIHDSAQKQFQRSASRRGSGRGSQRESDVSTGEDDPPKASGASMRETPRLAGSQAGPYRPRQLNKIMEEDQEGPGDPTPPQKKLPRTHDDSIPPMMMEAQAWYQQAAASDRETLGEMLIMAITAPEAQRVSLTTQFWSSVAKIDARAHNYPTYHTLQRKDGMLAALAGQPFCVKPHIVGVPIGIPRDGIHDLAKNFIWDAPARTRMAERPKWLGGTCFQCNRMLIDGLCVALCISNLPYCDSCFGNGHTARQCTSERRAPPPVLTPGTAMLGAPDASTTPLQQPHLSAGATPFIPARTYLRTEHPGDNRRLREPRRPGGTPISQKPPASEDENDILVRSIRSKAKTAKLDPGEAQILQLDLMNKMFTKLTEDKKSSNSFTSVQKMQLEKIPMFDGEDRTKFDDWVFQVLDASDEMDKDVFHIAKLRSKGDFYNALSDRMAGTKSWVELIELLRPFYSHVPNRTAAADMLRDLRQEPKENINTFVNRYTNLFRYAYQMNTTAATDEISKIHFLRTIRNQELTMQIMLNNTSTHGSEIPGSLYDLMQRVISETQKLQLLELTKVNYQDTPTLSKHRQRVVTEEPDQPVVRHLGEQGPISIRKLTPASSQGQEYEDMEVSFPSEGFSIRIVNGRPKLVCWQCGGDHIKANCPQLTGIAEPEQKEGHQKNSPLFPYGGRASITSNPPPSTLEFLMEKFKDQLQAIEGNLYKKLKELLARHPPMRPPAAEFSQNGNARDRRKERRQGENAAPAVEASPSKEAQKAAPNQTARNTSTARDNNANGTESKKAQPKPALSWAARAVQLISEMSEEQTEDQTEGPPEEPQEETLNDQQLLYDQSA